jgi:aryl-alcohol dehydrogenase-like predicted oxidoreductase
LEGLLIRHVGQFLFLVWLLSLEFNQPRCYQPPATMNPFTQYTFGSMSLGRNPSDITNDLAVARRAMDAGVWFHSSPTYNQGFAFMVLRLAFDADRTRVPRMVIKVRDATASLMRFEVEDSCRRLGLDAIDVAQLVSMDSQPGNLVDQLRSGGGPLVDHCCPR